MTFSSPFLNLSLFSVLSSIVCVSGVSLNFLEKERSVAELQQDAAAAVAASIGQARRELFWTIDYEPGADPDFVCDAFQKAANGTYECACDMQPDKTVGLKCLELETTCNPDGSLCFYMNVNMFLTATNEIKELETCTVYADLNFTRFEGSSIQLANYSSIMPCVKVVPKTVGDFSTLESCSATINEQPCHKCEICTDDAPAVGITMDCCNTNPDGEQLKVTCGPMGGGGAFAPFFDTYEEGNMETCSGAVSVGLSGVVGLLVFWVVVAVAVFPGLN